MFLFCWSYIWFMSCWSILLIHNGEIYMKEIVVQQLLLCSSRQFQFGHGGLISQKIGWTVYVTMPLRKITWALNAMHIVWFWYFLAAFQVLLFIIFIHYLQLHFYFLQLYLLHLSHGLNHLKLVQHLLYLHYWSQPPPPWPPSTSTLFFSSQIGAIQVTNANFKLELKFVVVRIHKDDMAVIVWQMWSLQLYLWFNYCL